MAATPEQIWAVLADPMSYERWVVGAQDIRTADGSWPEPGSTLHHTSGFGPLTLKDSTKVLESEPARRIVLEARGRPLGIARIEMRLEQKDEGTLVTMVERIARPPVLSAVNWIFDPLVHSRNVETLRRLEEVTLDGVGAGPA